jgi:hypothetical protein
MKSVRGQSYTEYVVVTLAIVLALLAKDEDGQPYLKRVIDVIKANYQGYTTSIALPELPANLSRKK